MASRESDGATIEAGLGHCGVVPVVLAVVDVCLKARHLDCENTFIATMTWSVDVGGRHGFKRTLAPLRPKEL